jgi:hypothetical protein
LRMLHHLVGRSPLPAEVPPRMRVVLVRRDASDRAVLNGNHDPAQRRTDTAAGDAQVHNDTC